MSNVTTVQELTTFAKAKLLKQLEKTQRKFNIFEAIGATHKELWHSDFLAYLLDPRQNHGLDDEFAKQLLGRIFPELAVVDSWKNITVRREYRNIDILIEDEERQISLIIENKIWSPEAPGQLAAYWNQITSEHPTWKPYGIFLTPIGLVPMEPCDREHYHALSYRAVKDILKDVLKEKSSEVHAEPAVELTVQHYIDMLGRFIVGDEDVESMARKLYFDHKAAIQLMDPAIWKGWIKSHLDQLIRVQAEHIQHENTDKTYIYFRVLAWDSAEGLKAGSSNNTSYPLLYFGFHNNEESLTLYLWVRSSISPEVRANILELGKKHVPPFCEPVKYDYQWHYCYRLNFLVDENYHTLSNVELKTCIDAKWSQFIHHDLPLIRQVFESADWFMHASEQPTQS